MAGSEIVIEPGVGVWVVRAQGAVIGESSKVLILKETDCDDVVYIPRDDLEMVFFDRSETVTECPHKGSASHFSLVGKNRREENVGWSYEAPLTAVSAIAGHLAFYKGTVTVEAVS